MFEVYVIAKIRNLENQLENHFNIPQRVPRHIKYDCFKRIYVLEST